MLVCGICGEDSKLRTILNATLSECGSTFYHFRWLFSSQVFADYGMLDKICAICLEKIKIAIGNIIDIRRKFAQTQMLLKTYFEKLNNMPWAEFKKSSITEGLQNEIHVLNKMDNIDNFFQIKIDENSTHNVQDEKTGNDNIKLLAEKNHETSISQEIKRNNPNDIKIKPNLSSVKPKQKITKRGYIYTTSSGEYVIKKSDGTFICKICKKSFKYSCRAENHVRSAHTNEKPFKCDFCKKSFTASHILKRHLACVHNEAKYICEKCGQEFNRLYNLVAHEKIHDGPPNIQCSFNDCEKKFYSNLALKSHIDRTHKEKKIVCDQCGKLFRFYNKMLLHCKSKHKMSQKR